MLRSRAKDSVNIQTSVQNWVMPVNVKFGQTALGFSPMQSLLVSPEAKLHTFRSHWMIALPPTENKLRFIAIILSRAFCRSSGQWFQQNFHKSPIQIEKFYLSWVMLGIASSHEFCCLILSNRIFFSSESCPQIIYNRITWTLI